MINLISIVSLNSGVVTTNYLHREVAISKNNLLKLVHYNISEPDDEYHAMLACLSFTANNKKYLKKYYWTRATVVNMQELFNVRSKNCPT